MTDSSYSLLLSPHDRDARHSPLAPSPGTLDPWGDANRVLRRSPSPISPTTMSSFMSKAKAVLRGKRGSTQVSDTTDSAKPGTHRSNSHYQTHSTRPTLPRRTTAPLPPRSLSSPKPARPPLKKTNGSYPISRPMESNVESSFTHCKLIDTAEAMVRSSRFLSTADDLVRSPSPSQYSEVETPEIPAGTHQAPFIRKHRSSSDSAFSTHADVFRPKSDVFPLSATTAGLEPVRLEDRAHTKFNSSCEPLMDPVPFDPRRPVSSRVHDFSVSSSIQSLGFGPSGTIMAICDAGMLDELNTHPDETKTASGDELGSWFSDAADEDHELDSALQNGLYARSWLGARPTQLGGYAEQAYGSGDIVDDYIRFGEDTLAFSGRMTESTTDISAASCVAVENRTDSDRPNEMSRSLVSMDTGAVQNLLSSWRAQLDPTCSFRCQSADAERAVMTSSGQDLMGSQPLPDATYPTNPTTTRSRSRTLTVTPTCRPELRRQLTAPETHFAVSSYVVTESSLPTASSSRVPDPKPTAAKDVTVSKRRRTTRQMFFDSQVAHVAKGSHNGNIRNRYRSRVNLSKVATAEGYLTSQHQLPRSSARRTLYASSPKAVHSAKVNRRSGMIKSPSVRSGLSKSGFRRGLAASKSRLMRSEGRAHTSGSRISASGAPLTGRLDSSVMPPCDTLSMARSLPGNSNKAGPPGTRNPPPRPPRVRTTELWDRGDKENVPEGLSARRERKESGSTLRSRTTSPCYPSSPNDGYYTTRSHTPNTSAPQSPRWTNNTVRPSVPPRSPARPGAYNRI